MKKKHTNKIKAKDRRSSEGGQVVMAAVLVFMTLSLVVVIGISAPISAQIRNSSILLESRKAAATAEVLTDDAFYRLNSGRTLPASLILSLNQSTSTATISDIGNDKRILTTALSKATSRSTDATFNYGGSAAPINHALHAGQGGFDISGGSQVIGDIYANGNVTGSGGSSIAGSVTAASTLAETLIIDNTNTSAIFSNVEIGKVNSVQQIAQAFTVTTSTPITAFSFYIKKTGAPANGIVRVFNKTGGGNTGGGNVGNSQQGATAALSAALVTSSYGWVNAYPYSPITLTPGNIYHLTLEVQGSNSANFYTVATNNSAYSGGSFKTRIKTGTSWASYVDATPTTMDLIFGAYAGGVTYISGNGWDTLTVSGSANAGTVNSTDAVGAIYCQNGNQNNKACDVSQPIPTAVPMPIFTERIAAWKAIASAGTIRNSSWSLNSGEATTTPGTLKIVGDLTVGSGSTLTLRGPLYVTGTITVTGGSSIRLDPTYGTGDEFIVAGYTRSTGGGLITGSGTAGSYVIVVADSVNCSSPCNGSTYVSTADGGTDSMVLVAPNGTLEISGGAELKAAMAKTIIMKGGSKLTYEPALAEVTFATVPTGWTVGSWKEVE